MEKEEQSHERVQDLIHNEGVGLGSSIDGLSTVTGEQEDK